jgi:chloramphenicol O-acetyltransferase type A
MGYRVVENYHRQELFDFFRGYHTPFYSITFELDCTRLKDFADEHDYPVYLNLCYFFTRGMQPIEDFRYRLMDGRIVLYDELEVAATLPAPGGLFSFAYFGFDPEVQAFNERAREIDRSARERVALSQPEDTNHVLFTAIPGVSFTGVTHAKPADPTDARPRVAFGKFSERSGRLVVPVGLEVNHIFIDGLPLGELAEAVQREYNEAG